MAECLFCRIIARKAPGRIIYEDEHCVALEDINPQAPVHILVIPKRHVDSMAQVTAADGELMAHLLLIVNRMAKEKKIIDKGYRTVINTGSAGGQSVYHLHLHLLGGRPMHWPPG